MNVQRVGTIVLLAATGLVAASILAGGDVGKILNGMAGLTWFAAAGLLGIAAAKTGRGFDVWASAIVLTAGVAFLVKPTDFLPAILGFGLAGSVIALIARRDAVLWATFIVGLYLPMHIGTAVGKAIYRSIAGQEASIRSEPPPTAAMIPFVMLAPSVAGALVATMIMERRRERQSLSSR